MALFITGKKHEPNWTSSGEATGIYELKAYLQNLFTRLGVDYDRILSSPVEGKKDLYADGVEFRVNDKVIAELAIIRQAVLKKFDIRNDVYYAVINWDDVLKLRGDHHIRHTELPRFPEVRRDLSLLLDQSITFAQIRDLAFATESKLLIRVDLFDVYEGEQVTRGKKSYAVSFILQDTQTTLTDERIDRVMNRLMDAYTKELGAVIR